jgi:hypothetical protein
MPSDTAFLMQLRFEEIAHNMRLMYERDPMKFVSLGPVKAPDSLSLSSSSYFSVSRVITHSYCSASLV